MLRLIARRLILPVAAHVVLWVDRNWPAVEDLYDPEDRFWPVGGETDVDDDSLLDYVVRHDVQVPDDARELAP